MINELKYDKGGGTMRGSSQLAEFFNYNAGDSSAVSSIPSKRARNLKKAKSTGLAIHFLVIH